MHTRTCDTLVIGAGIVGISVAYYLKTMSPGHRVVLVDAGQPMGLTSAQSGENYRNWWPHPYMTAFTDRSIDLMEEIAAKTGNRIAMSRRGYALASRSADLDAMLAELQNGYRGAADSEIRMHDGSAHHAYQAPVSADWMSAPSGVDVIAERALIRRVFPSFGEDIRSVVHIRRAGAISGQQLGQFMLEHFRDAGGELVTGKIEELERTNQFVARLAESDEAILAGQVVNAAGPFINDVATMLGAPLPVQNVLQQKLAFEDRAGAIPRDLPFSIDLDPQTVDWAEEDIALLAGDTSTAWLTEEMPGGIHCRPEGGDAGTWIKLGWAFNCTPGAASVEPTLLDTFPEIVLRGAARLNPVLKTYYGRLPRNARHYGGFYTLTEENWPLIGETDVPGFYIAGAMSGFGTMAACAAGELCARTVLGLSLPEYAAPMSPQRYVNHALMAEVRELASRGIL